MPSLQSLPLELRQKIYTLAFDFSSSDAIKIAGYPRQKDTKSSSEEVALTVLRNGQAVRTPINDNALIRVSKEVSADARPILYGYHKFTFENSRALELFLDQIKDMKQHLRHIALGPSGYEHETGPQSQLYGATKRSFVMLAAAAGLQTLSVSHYDFCRILHIPRPNDDLGNLVAASAQLLQAIHNARKAKGLKVDLASLLEIIKIDLPNCAGCFTCDKSGAQYTTTKRGILFTRASRTRRLRCCCKCREAVGTNEMLMKTFKRSVAETLQLG